MANKVSKNTKIVLAILLACVLIAIIPLMTVKNTEFGGADGKAEEAITEIDANYEPWAESFISPPGGETESLLFSLQAALGAGIIGFGFGTLRERSKAKKKLNAAIAEKDAAKA